MTNQPQVILCTCPSMATAKQIAYQLIEQRLAACVNIVPQIQSIYRWQDKIEESSEWLLIIKSQQQCYNTLQETIRQNHPYQVPEIIALAVQKGLPAYLEWINSELNIKLEAGSGEI